MAARVKDRLRDPLHGLQRRIQGATHGRDLRAVQDNTARIRSGDILLFCTLRNEADRLPFFLDWYRKVGVDHFLIVDNGSTDGFMKSVREQADLSTWTTDASYRDANYGMHWLNALLHRYGRGHWCLSVDADEFLLYPHSDRRTLRDLADFLDADGRQSLACLMVDMVSDRPLEELVYRAGDDPFRLAPWFDSTGYVQREGWLQDMHTRGGARRRLFYRSDPENAPTLNKTPFVKWRAGYHYFLSTHQLVPGRLNRPHDEGQNSPTGCLMHFKYFAQFRDKVEEELARGQHWDASAEYRRYRERLDGESAGFTGEVSVRFEDWRQLVALGLMNRGTWF